MLLAIYTRITETWRLVRGIVVQLSRMEEKQDLGLRHQLELEANQLKALDQLSRMDTKLDLILVELTPGRAEVLGLEAGPVQEQP